jgi:hypothetical protein
MERPTEFADISGQCQTLTRKELEWRSLLILPVGDQGRSIAEARAEREWRDREYAEGQEISRRKFETDHQANRQDFEEKLAQRQMDHSATLPKAQLDTAQAAARAAKWAAWAAGVAALGAIGQVIVAIVK